MPVPEGLGPGYDAVLCGGYHSRAGALGVLGHGFMGHENEAVRPDGRPVGRAASRTPPRRPRASRWWPARVTTPRARR
nr:M55 family metallopeptidase [Streptomyces sp. BK340]